MVVIIYLINLESINYRYGNAKWNPSQPIQAIECLNKAIYSGICLWKITEQFFDYQTTNQWGYQSLITYAYSWIIIGYCFLNNLIKEWYKKVLQLFIENNCTSNQSFTSKIVIHNIVCNSIGICYVKIVLQLA